MSAPIDPGDQPSQRAVDAIGSLVVGPDENVEIGGFHNGSVEVYGSLTISGTLSGPLAVESLGRVTIPGDVKGSIDVRVAATVNILPSGRVAGTISNHGSVINQGWRSGRVLGRQPEDAEGSTVAEPLPGVERYPSLPQR